MGGAPRTRSVSEHVRSADGVRIAYQRLGAGPPVVAVHGGLGTWRSWHTGASDKVAAALGPFLTTRLGEPDLGSR